jgi:hypothetical protein
MEEAPKLSPQAILRKDLIDGRKSPLEFLSEVIKLGQSDPSRSAAPENAKLLDSEEIRKMFIGTELESGYYNDLSLSFFHQGQILAAAGDTSALDSFKRALVAAEGVTTIEDYDWWTQYVRGTVAYLSFDTEGLRAAIAACSGQEDDRNLIILKNFLSGLEKRGTTDYLADYSKPTTS